MIQVQHLQQIENFSKKIVFNICFSRATGWSKPYIRIHFGVAKAIVDKCNIKNKFS